MEASLAVLGPQEGPGQCWRQSTSGTLWCLHAKILLVLIYLAWQFLLVRARMVKSVDTRDLKSLALNRRASSILASGTINMKLAKGSL